MTDSNDADSERESLPPEEFVEKIVDDTPKIQDGNKSFTGGLDGELDEFLVVSDEQLLRVLATHPSKPRTHEDFAERTNLDSNTITEALERLETQGLVDDRSGHYFIPESRQPTVDGLLSDTRQLRDSATDSTPKRSLSELDPQGPDAHVLTLIYTNPSRDYSVVEIRDGLEDTVGFTRDTIEAAISRLYDGNRIRQTAEGQYTAIESCEELRRFASSMESTKRMFECYGGFNVDTDE